MNFFFRNICSTRLANSRKKGNANRTKYTNRYTRTKGSEFSSIHVIDLDNSTSKKLRLILLQKAKLHNTDTASVRRFQRIRRRKA